MLLLSFVPMLLVALGYKYLNKADPDAGTTFSWATRAFGPKTGWMGGWAIIVADIIVMANLAADRRPATRFLLFGVARPVAAGRDRRRRRVDRDHDRRLRDRHRGQRAHAALAADGRDRDAGRLRGGRAGARLHRPRRARRDQPTLSWFSPFAIASVGALTAGLLVAVFIYWGWDSLVTVNEETEDSETTPGKAAVMSTLILVGIYLIVATAAIAFGGVDRLAGDQSGDVLGLLAGHVFGSSLLGKIVIVAVLTSAAASTQTTILPTSRTALSMARAKAAPGALGTHPSALPDAARRDVDHGRAVDRLVRRPDRRSARTCCSTRSPRSA